MKTKLRLSILIILIALTLAACSGNQEDTDLDALSQSISLTATANAANAFDSGADAATAEAQATMVAAGLQATQEALASQNEEAAAATATAAAPYVAMLPTYGVDPANGRLGWIHPPVALDVEGYLQFDYANQFIGTVAKDFVVSADITWNTSGGLAGCGFVLRSDGNQDALNQYLAIATRGGNGRVLFSSMVNGELKNTIDNYAYRFDPNFQWQNDTTNNLTVVGQDHTFRIYTNGVLIGEVEAGEAPPALVLPPAPAAPPADALPEEVTAYEKELAEYNITVDQMQVNYQASLAAYQEDTPFFERGFIALVALSESGNTHCQFDNAWLWLIE